MKFLISKRARRHIEAIQAWWSKNRPSSPGLFLEELYEVERRLRDSPSLGVVYVAHKSGVVRRVLLVRTKRHVYFRFRAERDELVVLAVWGPREREARDCNPDVPTMGTKVKVKADFDEPLRSLGVVELAALA